MSETRFDLVILSHTASAPVEELVQNLLELLNKAGDSYLEYKLSEALLFEQNSSAVIEHVTLEAGKALQDKFLKLKVKTELRPTLQLIEKDNTAGSGKSHTCPACEHQQEKAAANTMNTCQKCGVISEKFLLQQKKEAIYSSEKYRLEQQQQKDIREVRERARHTEEERMREEARQRLGLTKKSQVLNTLVSVTVVLVMGVAIYFIADTLRSSNTDSLPAEEEVGSIPTQTTDTINPSAAIGSGTTGKTGLVTIQGGNGSIVINNPPTAQGSGGPKGTSNAADGIVPTSLTDQLNTTPASGNGTAQQTTTGTDGTTQAGMSELQLASLGKETEQLLQKLAVRAEAPRSLITGNRSLSFGKTDLLEQTAEEEAATLKTMLLTKAAEPVAFFRDTDAKQYTEHQHAVQRLLEMNKSDLALVFIEDLQDSYAASWLTLEVAAYERKRNAEDIQDAPLLTMKSLTARGKDTLQHPLLQTNLSQLYYMAGDNTASNALQEESIRSLKNLTIHPVDKLYMLRLMEATARQSDNIPGSLFYTRALAAYVSQLPADQPLLAGRAYTALAAIALNQQEHEVAISWAKKIPSALAAKKLTKELESRQEKAMAKMPNRLQLDPTAASD